MLMSFTVLTLALSLGAIPMALASPVAAGTKAKQYTVNCPGMSPKAVDKTCKAAPHKYHCNLEGMIGYNVPNKIGGCGVCKCVP